MMVVRGQKDFLYREFVWVGEEKFFIQNLSEF